MWHSNRIGVASSTPGVAKMVVDIQENDGWDYLMARISRPPPTHYFHLRWDGQIEEIGAPQDDGRSDSERMVSLGGEQVVSLAKLKELFQEVTASSSSFEELNQDGNSEEAEPTFQVPVVVNSAEVGATIIPVPARRTKFSVIVSSTEVGGGGGRS